MREMEQRTEAELLPWVKKQLEEKEVWYGCPLTRERLKQEIYEILFREQRMTVEEIEQSYIPYGQAGYLSTRCKFELMLFVLEKEYGGSFLFFESAEPRQIITREDVENSYIQWMLEERLFLSEEEKKEFFVQIIMDQLGLGVVEVLKRMSTDGILLGELCPALYKEERAEERIAVCVGGKIVRLPFLAIETKEELIRIIKYAVALENRGELTMREPIFDRVREDGTCITAVRPPAGNNWGIRILYSAAGKEGEAWSM